VQDDEAVEALLAAAGPRSDVLPGTAGVRGWLGARVDGELVACGALTRRVAGAGHLASIATLPSSRGRGVGGAVTAALTRWSLRGVGDEVCTLGMYADNEAARRMYRRLGYRLRHEFSSRPLLP
jgi:ribosomal protein S18 acetylase RimI-like enzyme